MEKLFAFIAENGLLFGAWVAAIAMLIWHEARKGGQTLTPSQVSQLVNQENALLVDVRDSAEFRKGHLTDAINIPYAKLRDQLGSLEKHRERPVVLVCEYGSTAGAAGKILKEAGFGRIFRLGGGIMEWRNQQLPLVKK